MPSLADEEQFLDKFEERSRQVELELYVKHERSASIVSPAAGAPASVSRKPLSKIQTVKSLLSALKALDGAVAQAEALSTQRNGGMLPFPAALLHQLSALRKQAAACTESLREAQLASSNPIETLLGMRDADWNFDTEAIRAYRAKRAKAHQALVGGQSWAQPQYTSSAPLPGSSSTLLCKVFVPGRKAALDIKVNKNYTVHDLLSSACPAGLAAADRVFKVVGREEFLTDLDTPVMSHACIRDAVRARKVPCLRLVDRAPPIASSNMADHAAVDLAAEYISSATATAPPIIMQQPKSADEFLPLSEVTVPVRCQVQGIEGVTQANLPRFDHTISHVFIRMWLIHGSTVLAGGQRQSVTASVPLSAAPRWSQWLHSENIKLSQLPRETRVCFTLHGERAPGLTQLGKTEVLGWVSQQLFDEQGRLLQGQQDLGLWSLPARTANEAKRLQKQAGDSSRARSSSAPSPCFPMGPGDEHDFLWTLMRGPSEQNLSIEPKALMTVKMAQFVLPVVASEQVAVPNTSKPLPAVSEMWQLDAAAQRRLTDLLGRDALYALTDADRRLLFLARQLLTPHPHMLPFFLHSVDWSDRAQRHEVKRLLHVWSPPTALPDILALLNVHFADTTARELAVRQLSKLPSDQLRSSLLQLTQALKFEPFHDNALSRLLLQRAQAEPTQVAHHLFWHLKSSLHELPCVARFSLLLEELLSFCGTAAPGAHSQAVSGEGSSSVLAVAGQSAPHAQIIDNLRVQRRRDHSRQRLSEQEQQQQQQQQRYARPPPPPPSRAKMGATEAAELAKQNLVVSQLQLVAEMIAARRTAGGIDDNALTAVLHRELEQLNDSLFSRVGSFQIPLDPRLRATTLVVNKCRFMSSKKVPLWLVFNNADPDGDTIYVIFKSGDDLRQDMLTLQLLRYMDELWLGRGLDLRLKPYDCVLTGVNEQGEGVGMIEIVRHADTTANIQFKFGGGAAGALKLKPLLQYLEHHNPGLKSMMRAKDNFIRSCAGYCVATYVLGIGDRHNGNIMVTEDGHLFHIDFGHFLGNFKTFKGIYNRERAAFVFTPSMAYVIGGADYQNSSEFERFMGYCLDALSALRDNASGLETLFDLMVAAAMPELSSAADIGYLRDRLCLSCTDEEAREVFRKELRRSVNAVSRRLDNYAHIKKHNKKK